jgi:two-component sensor histidine kinase
MYMFHKIEIGFIAFVLGAYLISSPALAVDNANDPNKFKNQKQYADFDAMWIDWDQNYREKSDYFSFANVADLERILSNHLHAARKSKDITKIARVAIPLSAVFHYQSKFEQSLPLFAWLNTNLNLVPRHYWQEILSKIEEEYRAKNQLGEAIAIRQKRIQLGYINAFWEIYRDCGLYEEAIKDFIANQSYPTSVGKKRIFYFERLGNLYFLNGQYAVALQKFSDGLAQTTQLLEQDKKTKRYLVGELAYWQAKFSAKRVMCLIKQGIYTDAIKTLQQNLIPTKEDIDHQTLSMILISQCYLHEKKHAQARIYLDSAKSNVSGKVIRPINIELFATTAKFHESIKQLDSATYYLKMQNHFQDSLNGIMNRNQTLLLLGQLEVSKRRAEMLASKNELMRVTKISEIQQIQLRSLALLLLVIIVTVFVSYIIIRQKYLLKVRADQIVLQNSRNEILLKELHHRVKNNLQVIYSLLNLQRRRVHNQESDEFIRSLQNRIQSFALVHSNLHDAQDFEFVNVDAYIKTLVAHLIQVFQREDDKPLSIAYAIDPSLRLSLEKITSFGLILNEIISNAFKYAFTGKEGGILTIQAELKGKDLHILISDNGPGKKADLIDSGHLGLKLITLMCKQMYATHKLRFNNGVIHEITINYK